MPEPAGADPKSDSPARRGEDGLMLVGPDGRLRWCNPAAEQLLRRRGADLIGRPWQDLLPESTARRHAEAQLARGEPFDAFDLVLASGGGAQQLHVACHALPGGDRLCVLRDAMPELERVRETQRLAELLEMAQEFGRIGVWEREIPSGRGRWDRHVFGFWGLDPAAGTPSHEAAVAHIHPDDRTRMNYQASTLRPGRHAQHYRVVRADGTVRRIHSQWEVKTSADGVPDRAIGVMVDDTEVYELARALDDASAQLRLAIELGSISIWRHDLATDRVQYNEGTRSLLAVPADGKDLSLEELRAFVHPDDLALVVRSAQAALQGDGPTDIEARMRGRDGSWRTVLTRRVLERAADGTPRAFVGIALDVTAQVEARRRAEEHLRRTEAAVAAAGVGIWSYDGDRPIWNQTHFALVGRDPALGVPSDDDYVAEIVHPEDRGRMRAMIDRGATGEIQYRVTLPGGEVRWLEDRVRSELRDGRKVQFGVTLDVTQRRLAEEALHSAAERAMLAARGAGIGTWELDAAGAEQRWDEQMFHLRGLEPRPQPPPAAERLALVHPDDLPLVFDSWSDGWSEVDVAQYEFRVRWPDGSYRWLASRSKPVFDEAGRPQRRIGVNWDITESKLAEAALRETAIAQRESQAKSEFLSRVSHELRTPLNAVLGFTQLLQAEPALPDTLRARLGWVRSAADHLLLLINDMLDLNSLASGELRLAPRPVALAGLVHEALPLVASLAERHGVAVQADAIDGVALADPTRLRQVLINLLSNAIKYNRPQGRVTVSAGAANGRVVLRVQDSGHGLTAAQISHLYEPFNRLGAERHGIEGRGLGLVIVKSLVERMGGEVGVASTAGRGATFSVALPAAAAGAEAAPRPAPAAPTPAAATARAGRVLCIEDNPVNMLLVEELLAQRPGVQMLAASTGEQGVRIALDARPDLALVDMQLPDIDGHEVLRRLRADARTRGLRCIALSANALPDDVARALAAGFADYWTKPIDFGLFLRGIDAALA